MRIVYIRVSKSDGSHVGVCLDMGKSNDPDFFPIEIQTNWFGRRIWTCDPGTWMIYADSARTGSLRKDSGEIRCTRIIEDASAMWCCTSIETMVDLHPSKPWHVSLAFPLFIFNEFFNQLPERPYSVISNANDLNWLLDCWSKAQKRLLILR